MISQKTLIDVMQKKIKNVWCLKKMYNLKYCVKVPFLSKEQSLFKSILSSDEIKYFRISTFAGYLSLNCIVG